MEIALAVGVLISLIAILVGLIMALIRKPRKHGFKIAGFATLAFMISITAFGWVSDRSAEAEGFLSMADRNEAQDAGFTSAEQWALVRDDYSAPGSEEVASSNGQEQPQIQAEPAPVDLGDFPDQLTQQAASQIGIRRYAAYRLLDDRDAINSFCEYEDQTFVLSDVNDEQLVGVSDETRLQQLASVHEAAQQHLLDKTNSALGLEEYELLTLASAGEWWWYCGAQDRGWAVLTREEALNASRSDARAAQSTIVLHYLSSLDDSDSTFFNSERFRTAACDLQLYEGFRIVGCRLRSFTGDTTYDLFVIGRDAEDRLLVAPLTGRSGQNLASRGSVLRSAGFRHRLHIGVCLCPSQSS